MNPIGLGASLIPQIVGFFKGIKQHKAADAAAQKADGYFNQASGYGNNALDYSKQNLATAQNAYNGRMPGASNLEQNIYGNQGNTLAALGRNASSGSQLLALAGGVQGNSNSAFSNLAQSEMQNKMYQQQNLNFANQGVQAAENNLQNLNYNQSLNAQQQASQLARDATTNQGNAINGLGNIGMMAGMGGFGNILGGGNSGGYMSGGALGGIDPSNLQLPQYKPNFQLPLNRFNFNG